MIADLPPVVINEIAWMGTSISYNDEWIELYNNTGQEINLDGWILKAADGSPEIKLARTVLANGFYLLERTDDNTLPGIAADQVYTGALENGGEILGLYDNAGNLIDSIDASAGWPAGDNTTKQTMEKSLSVPGTDNWQNSREPGGTPAAENSSPPAQKATDTGFPPASGSPLVSSEDSPAPPAEAPPPQAELTAVSEPLDFASGKQSKNSGTSFLLGAAIFTSFSGGVMILILKKKLKIS